MSTNDGGPAFPHEYKYGDGTAHRSDGMTLRDWFAGMALQGELAAQNPDSGFWHGVYPELAERCYQVADAMLAARGKS